MNYLPYEKRINPNVKTAEISRLYSVGKSVKDISIELNCTMNIVHTRIRKEGIERRQRDPSKERQIYNIDQNFFETINTSEKAYVLGLITADGNISGNYLNISLHNDDTELLFKVKELINYDGPLLSRKGKNITILQICNKKIREDLEKLGLVENKSLVATFLNIPQQFNRDFIRGVFDGDGCVFNLFYPQKQSNRVKVARGFNFVGAKSLLESISSILEKETSIKSTKLVTKLNIFSISYGSIDAIKKMYDYLYSNPTIYMERKYNKFKTIING